MSDRKVSDAAIVVVANWWFDKFLGPNHSNGAIDPANMLANVMSGMLADGHPVTEEQRQPFIDAMREVMDKERPYYNALGTDYDPERTLAEAMEKAEIHTSRISYKTSVNVGQNGIYVGPGYGAPYELLCRLDGTEPTERWVLSSSDEHGTHTVYAYSLWEHHGNIAKHRDYSDAAYTDFTQHKIEGEWQ